MRSYENWHKYLRHVRGSATLLSCTGCGGVAQEWALKAEFMEVDVPRKYVEDLQAYQPMCRACHKQMDLQFMGPGIRAKISSVQKGRKHSDETRAKMSASYKPKTPEQIAKGAATRRRNGYFKYAE